MTEKGWMAPRTERGLQPTPWKGSLRPGEILASGCHFPECHTQVRGVYRQLSPRSAKESSHTYLSSVDKPAAGTNQGSRLACPNARTLL